jgi:ABC-type transporter Mla subunit MlaD
MKAGIDNPYTKAETDGSREGLGLNLDAMAAAEAKNNAARRREPKKPKPAFDAPVTDKELANLPHQAEEVRQLDFRIDDTLRQINNLNTELAEALPKLKAKVASIRSLESSHEPRILERVRELRAEQDKLAAYVGRLNTLLEGKNRILAHAKGQREAWVAENAARYNYVLGVSNQLEGRQPESGFVLGDRSRMKSEGNIGDKPPVSVL